MDAGFVTAIETINNKYITHVGSHFSLGSTAQTKLFAISRIYPKMFEISRILAEFLVYVIIRLIRISVDFFFQSSVFFRLQIGGLVRCVPSYKISRR